MKTYTVVRKFFKGDDQIIKTGLTLEEAQVHCQDPETSSSTCKKKKNVAITKKHGPWFDVYLEDTDE